MTLMAPTNQLGKLILAYRMNSLLHGPTLYVPLGTLAQPRTAARAARRDRGRQGHDHGAGQSACSGSTSRSRRRSTSRSNSAIDPGTAVPSERRGTQSMVTIAAADGRARADGAQDGHAATSPVPPCTSTSLARATSSAWSRRRRRRRSCSCCSDCPTSPTRRFRVQQFAIWTITDNPAARRLRRRWARSASAPVRATARSRPSGSCSLTAGLDPTTYQAFS